MSGRRAKQIRKRVAAGALVACSAFISDGQRAIAQTIAGTSGEAGTGSSVQLPVRRFNIPAGTTAETLAAWESVTGFSTRVTFDRDVLRNLHSPGAQGTMPDREALARILSETGITPRFDGRRVVLSLQVMSEEIEVSAPAREVTSQKFTQPLLETPRSVTVIPDTVIRAQGATTLRDVLRNTPGITFQAGEGGAAPGDMFSIRGFGAGNDILLDGVRESGAYSRDSFNLEQVEVIKGPAGAIAGRGSSGGAINLVTKSPDLDGFTRATFSGGTDEYMRVTADVNRPIESLPDAAFRASVMYYDADVPGRDIAHNSSWGVAPSLSFGIGKPSQFTLAYQHVTQDNVPDYGLPWAALGTVDQSNYYGLADYDYEDITSDAITATFVRDMISGWTLRNVSRWAENDRDSAITAPRPPRRQLQQRTMENAQLVNHTSVSGTMHTGSVTHDLVAGLEVGRETTFVQRIAQSDNQPETSLENPDPFENPFGPMPVNNGDPSDASLDLAGVYVFDTIQFGERWEATGGLRFDVVSAEFDSLDTATGEELHLTRDDEMLSWSTGLVYKPTTRSSVYVSASTAFNPSVEASTGGAALSDSPTSANNVNLEPEETVNTEIGAKYETPGGRATATAAIFRTEKTNARTRLSRGEPYTLNGEQLVEGVELSLTGRLTDGLTVLLGYSHLDSEFTSSDNPDEVGAALALVPENSFNLWMDQRLPGGFTIGGGAQYLDSVFRSSDNSAQVPSYWLIDAMASYDLTPSLTLRLNVNNLADEQYVDRVGGGHYIPGARRSASLNVEVDF